jgi:hypothetical protein
VGGAVSLGPQAFDVGQMAQIDKANQVNARTNAVAMMLELVKAGAVKFPDDDPRLVLNGLTENAARLSRWLNDGTAIGPG